MSEPFIAEIMMFGGNFPPRGWAYCDGQLLPIAQNQALISLLGTTYGGNGITLFALPDLRGRFPMHIGQGPGLSPRTLGERSGTENVTLTSAQLPPHSHAASSSTATQTSPAGHVPAVANDGESNYAPTANAQSAPSGGGGQPHDNMPPYLAVSFVIALAGIFPSRN